MLLAKEDPVRDLMHSERLMAEWLLPILVVIVFFFALVNIAIIYVVALLIRVTIFLRLGLTWFLQRVRFLLSCAITFHIVIFLFFIPSLIAIACLIKQLLNPLDLIFDLIDSLIFLGSKFGAGV